MLHPVLRSHARETDNFSFGRAGKRAKLSKMRRKNYERIFNFIVVAVVGLGGNRLVQCIHVPKYIQQCAMMTTANDKRKWDVLYVQLMPLKMEISVGRRYEYVAHVPDKCHNALHPFIE